MQFSLSKESDLKNNQLDLPVGATGGSSKSLVAIMLIASCPLLMSLHTKLKKQYSYNFTYLRISKELNNTVFLKRFVDDIPWRGRKSFRDLSFH